VNQLKDAYELGHTDIASFEPSSLLETQLASLEPTSFAFVGQLQKFVVECENAATRYETKVTDFQGKRAGAGGFPLRMEAQTEAFVSSEPSEARKRGSGGYPPGRSINLLVF
jgi:hypothetical protein